MSLQPQLKQQQAGSKNNKREEGGAGGQGVALAGTTVKCAAAH